MSITIFIIAITCLISYFGFQDAGFRQRFMHHPVSTWRNGEWYRLVTSGFLHGSWMHLGINMFVFYMFGQSIEYRFIGTFGPVLGAVAFLALYLTSITVADIPTLYKHKNNSRYAALGASGATSAILFAFILFDPWATLLLYAIIPIPAILAAIGFVAYEYYADKKLEDNIGHSAHLLGAIYGVLFMLIVYPDMWNIFYHRLVAEFPLG